MPAPAGTARPCEKVRVAGQAAQTDVTGLIGRHQLKFIAPDGNIISWRTENGEGRNLSAKLQE